MAGRGHIIWNQLTFHQILPKLEGQGAHPWAHPEGDGLRELLLGLIYSLCKTLYFCLVFNTDNMWSALCVPCQTMKTVKDGGGDGKALEMLMDGQDDFGNSLTDEEIEDNILMLLAAGYDTAAVMTMSVLYELQRNREVEAILGHRIILAQKQNLKIQLKPKNSSSIRCWNSWIIIFWNLCSAQMTSLFLIEWASDFCQWLTSSWCSICCWLWKGYQPSSRRAICDCGRIWGGVNFRVS